MIKKLLVKIEGVKPLLFHAFSPDVLDAKKPKQGSAGNNPEEWKKTVHMDAERRLYLPESYLYGPIKEAGRYSKIGRGNIIKYVSATLEVTPTKIYLENLKVPIESELTRDDTQEVYLDVRSAVNPMTKGRNLRYRIACKPGWKCEFKASWDDSVLSVEQMKQVIQDSGIMCGTGSGRAIGFGRYKVLETKLLD